MTDSPNITVARKRGSKRRPKIIRTPAGKIRKLPDGRFQINIVDSWGKRYRPGFKTQEEAAAQLAQIAAKKATGEFLADASNTTFSRALDLLLARNEREGLARTSRDRVRSVINAQLRPVFGERKLSEFVAQRMRFVQEWLDHQARHVGMAAMTLAHTRSALKLAFDEAIGAGLMGAPNLVNEFNLRVPRIVKKTERDVLTIEDITALVRGGLRRADKEHELTYCVRFMLVLIGLLAGLRNGECSGLSWDCIDFEGRMIHIRRSWRKGEGIIPETKTGRSGFRSIPMSPILCAALRAYGDRLQSMGRKLEGPVLATKQAPIIFPLEISTAHWTAVASKAGFVDQQGAVRHTFYALRHTCANLWRTIGIQPDRLMKLMGHTDYHTTVKNYLHETPHFETLRREVEREMQAFGMERTPEGFIDALGIVLVRRWRDEGIEIECAPPRSATTQLGYNGPIALPGNTIDVVPTTVSIPATPTGPVIKTSRDLKKWQLAHAKELALAGRLKWDIATELGISTLTLNEWLRTTGFDNVRLGRLPRVERQDLMEQIRQLRELHPEWSSTQIAKEVGVDPKRVTIYERRRGHAMPHRPGAHKIGKYETHIRRMVAEGLTCRKMAAELKRLFPKAKTPSHSGIGYFLQKLGLKTLRRGPGLRVENYDPQIREMIAAGKSKERIGRELDGPSRSGILAYIRRSGYRTVPGNRGKRIAKKQEAAE